MFFKKKELEQATGEIVAQYKAKRFRGRPGIRIERKKAIVTLAEGQSIDITTGIS